MSIFSWIKRGLLPPTCVFCLQRAEGNRDICQDCLACLPWLREGCIHCAYPLDVPELSICGTCLQKPPPYQRTIALFAYRAPIDRLLTDLKFNRQLLYAKLLGELLLEKIIGQSNPLPELLLPVPLHTQRLKERGYNQALELAKVLRKGLNIQLDKDSCQRVRATQPQTSLSAKKRLRNVKGAFALRKAINADHVAIIDDVVTTGHTVAEISKLLQNQGVKKIEIWCCARTFLA